MSLVSVGNPPCETIRGVRFSMLHGPTLVTVLVTHAALREREHVRSGEGGHLACFEKHRDAFEQVASAKHQRGLDEDNGAVIVQAGDLKTFTL
jgi:Protein of unknown function (DUF1488)